MQLTDEDIKKIAHLARLNLSPDEIAPYAEKLSGIFSFIEIINNVPTEHVEAMAHSMQTELYLRADHVTETDQHEKYQQNASSVHSDLYLVPLVIE